MDNRYIKVVDFINKNASSFYAYKNYLKSKRIGECDAFDYYDSLPIVTKYSMRENFKDYININISISAKDFSNIFDIKSISQNHDNEIILGDSKYKVEFTTGTTGKPFPVIKSLNTLMRQAVYLQHVRKNFMKGININNRLMFLHANNPIITNINLWEFNEKDLARIISYIIDQNVEWTFATPFIYKKLSNYIKNSYSTFNNPIKYLEYTSQPLNLDDGYTDIFSGSKFLNNFGCREFWNLSYSNDNSYKLNSEYLQIDIVDKNGKIITETDKAGDVIVTDLSNTSQGFIKYMLGDSAIYKIDKETNEVSLHFCKDRNAELILGTSINGTNVFRRVMRGIYFHDDIKDINKVLIEQAKNTFNVYIDKIDKNDINFEERFKFRTGLVLPLINNYDFKFIYTDKFSVVNNYKEIIFKQGEKNEKSN